MVARLKYRLTDPEGRTVLEHAQPSRSLLKGFMCLLGAHIAYSSRFTPFKDLGGITRYPEHNSVTMAANAAQGTLNYGTILGKGATPVTIEDYALEDQITHGSAEGQLFHHPQAFDDVSCDETSCTFPTVRSFVNLYSSSITIRELGLACRFRDHTGYYRNGLLIRDVITPTTVPPAYAMTVEYQIIINL